MPYPNQDDNNAHRGASSGASGPPGYSYSGDHHTGYADERSSAYSHAQGGAAHDAYGYAAAKSGGAGVGAGRNAYTETPSMYTDPFEYTPNAAGPARGAAASNVMGTHAYGGASNLGRTATLHTLAPHDSVSSYNVSLAADASPGDFDQQRDVSTHGGAPAPYGTQAGYDDDLPARGYAQDYPVRQSLDEYADRGGYYDDTHDDQPGGHGAYRSSTAGLPLRSTAAPMGYAEDEEDEWRQHNKGGEGAYPPPGKAELFSNALPPGVPHKHLDENEEGGLLGKIGGKVSAGWGGTQEEKIERRKRGIGRQRWPILSWLLAIAYVAVFIVSLIKSKADTGQAIQTRPSWNPMLGPPFEFLISFGARFTPCMRKVASVPTTTQVPCLNAVTLDVTSYSANQLCPVWQICGLKDADSVGQTYRYVTPIFLHAGFIHIIFNLLVQLTLCCQIEKLLSSPIYIVLFLAGGVGGNLLGAAFSLPGTPSVGASGAIYTCISVELIDLIYNWSYEYRARTRLTVSILFACIGFGIGLLPGLDNWAHIGGFVVGTLGGLAVCPSIHPTPKHRKIIWACRVIGAITLVGFFIGIGVAVNSEDPSKTCTWCRYLSCLPVFSQCKGNGLRSSTVTTTS